MGVLGYHPAELPKNRGRHPIIWALVLGLKRTASTFFFMDEGADTGDILSQYKINISKNDNAETLYNRIIEVAMKQVDEFCAITTAQLGSLIKTVQSLTVTNAILLDKMNQNSVMLTAILQNLQESNRKSIADSSGFEWKSKNSNV